MARRRLPTLLMAAIPVTLAAASSAMAQEQATETVLVTYSSERGLDRAVADGGALDAADGASDEVASRVAVAALTDAEISALLDNPGVLAIEPNAEVHVAEAPSDACYASPGSCGGLGAWHVDRVALPGAWDVSHGSGVTVAVVDSGMASVTADMVGKVDPEIDATEGGPVCTSGPVDHGTQVASIIGAQTDNGVGTAGAGWDVRILPVRVWAGPDCETTTLDRVVRGISLARQAGARVLNLSLTTVNATALRATIDDAVNAGVVVVAAAGNAGSDNPAQHPGGYPAFYPNVISVGATCPAQVVRSIGGTVVCNGQTDARASFSNHGAWVDLFAPGVALPAYTKNGTLSFVDGTSFASPVVAGVAALLLSVRPDLTPAQVHDALVVSADPVGGVLRLDARGALYHAVFGSDPAVGASILNLTSSTIEVATRANNAKPLVRTIGSGTTRWSELDGLVMGTPDLSSSGPGRLDLVARGIDGVAYHRTRIDGAWGPWASLGGSFTSDLSAVSWSPGRLDVFGRGLDGAIWHNGASDGVFTGWRSLGGSLSSEPDASAWSAGRLDVFARGLDGAMWHRAFASGSWLPWESLGGGFQSGAGAVSWSPNVIHIAARGLDSQIWSIAWTGTGYTAWQPLGGFLVSSPDLSTSGPGRLDVAARAGDHQVWLNRYDGAYTGWFPIS